MKTLPRMLIIIATYNEIDNLPRLIQQLDATQPDAQLLVIDDASPDGTGRWCDQAMEKYPQMSVIHRDKKLGLGSATIIGFQKAIAWDIPFVATMDADFSHDPAALTKLLASLTHSDGNQYSVAIGSRYVSGGSIVGWPLSRRLISRVVNSYSRRMLRLGSYDNSGAFRVYRTQALKQIDIEAIQSSGYSYLHEILWRLRRQGMQFIETPIKFQDRIHGRSKASIAIGIQVFWDITRMGLGWWR